jgi:hypothetical protein
VEQLQTIEKEAKSLFKSEKELASLKDQLEDKKIERSELHSHIEVGVLLMNTDITDMDTSPSVPGSNFAMHMTSSNEYNDIQRKSELPAKGL